MFGYYTSVFLKKYRKRLLGKPNGIVLKKHINVNFAISGLKNYKVRKLL